MKLRSMQVLRAAAVIGVVFFHASGAEFRPVETLAVLGAGGVDLFFVISGFIISTIARNRTPAEFIFDRLWRIYPLWWVAVLPFVLAYHPDWQRIASSLTLWPVYGNTFATPALILGWTLCFEMLFYAATALSLRTGPIIPMTLFAIAFPLTFISQNALVQFIGSPMSLEFLMGVAIARLPKVERIAAPATAIAVAWLLLAPLSVIRLDVRTSDVIFRVIAWGVPAALIVYSFLSLERRFTGSWVRALVLLGDASYSIYLFHILASKILKLHWLLEALAMVLTGVVIHLTLERWIMRVRRERKERRTALRSFPSDDVGAALAGDRGPADVADGLEQGSH